MKARCSKSTLKKVFGAVAGAVPSRSPQPILTDVLMVVGEDGRATLAGTDMEQGFVHDLEVESPEPGMALLPAERVRRALAAWADPAVEIEAGGRGVRLVGQSADYEFRTEDPALFPAPPGFDARDHHVVEASALKRLIARTSFAADPNATRSAVAGILVEPGDGTMTFTGLDGRHGGRQVVAATREGSPAPPHGVISIPPKALDLLDKHLDSKDAPVHASFSANHAAFRTTSAVITTTLVAGRWSTPFDKALPGGEPASRVEMTAGALAAAILQAAVLTDELTQSVDLRFEAGALRVTGVHESGRARSRVPIVHDGAPFEVRLTPSRLLMALKAMGESQPIRVELGGPDHVLTAAELKDGTAFQSFVIVTDDGYTYTIATMHVVGGGA